MLSTSPSNPLVTPLGNGGSLTQLVLNSADQDVLEVHQQPAAAAAAEGKPLVVVCGWYKSQAKHIRKYSSLYYDNGHNVVQLSSMTTDSLMTWGGSYLARLKAALQKIEEVWPGSASPVVFHVFSNGGLKHYFEFIRLANSDPSYAHWKGRLAGLVLDSSPAKLTPWSFAGAATGHFAAGMMKTASYYSIVLGAALYFPLWGLVTGNDRRELFGEPMLLEAGAWHTKIPHFYVFSESDTITDSLFVEEVIAKQREMGVPVSQLKLEGSAHVAHLMKHKDAYTKGILGFVKGMGN